MGKNVLKERKVSNRVQSTFNQGKFWSTCRREASKSQINPQPFFLVEKYNDATHRLEDAGSCSNVTYGVSIVNFL